MRILALKLAVDAVSFGLAQYPRDPSLLTYLFIFVAAAVIAIVLWLVAPFLARRITSVRDSEVDCGTLALSDLYAFAFLLVGLYFAVDALGPSLAWLHFALRSSGSDAPLSLEQKANYYALFGHLTKLVFGLALIFNNRRFAVKLLKKQNKT